MKKNSIGISIVLIFIGLVWYFVSHPPVPEETVLAPLPISQDTGLPQVYSSSEKGFSIRLPKGFTSDPAYFYQLDSKKTIPGVKFTIPTTLKEGTNLSSDSYISIETLSGTSSCTADLFLDGTHIAETVTDNGKTYSRVAASNAGAGNRYEETVYAIPGTSPCMVIRYFIHYGAFENYPAGSIRAFDQEALIQTFDQIRYSLTYKS